MFEFLQRCGDCGRTTSVPVLEVLEQEPPHADYSETRARRRERVSAMAGTCACGGSFSEDAPLRCPDCRTTEVDPVQIAVAN